MRSKPTAFVRAHNSRDIHSCQDDQLTTSQVMAAAVVGGASLFVVMRPSRPLAACIGCRGSVPGRTASSLPPHPVRAAAPRSASACAAACCRTLYKRCRVCMAATARVCELDGVFRLHGIACREADRYCAAPAAPGQLAEPAGCARRRAAAGVEHCNVTGPYRVIRVKCYFGDNDKPP